MQVLPALLMATVAGLSTGIGGVLGVLPRRCSSRFLAFSLAFSAGIMATVSIGEMLPESQRMFAETVRVGAAFCTVFYLFAGLLITGVLEHLLPQEKQAEEQQLFGVGIVTAVGIMVHNFPEGMVTFMAGCVDLSLGLSLMAAISLHNIPEGISVAVPIYHATGSRFRAFGAALLSGMAEPVGAILAWLFLRNLLDRFGLALLYAAISGIMLYISFGELLPAANGYGHEKIRLCGILTGIAVMVLGLGLL